MSAMNPQTLAEACAKAMWANDQASQGLGMSLDGVAPGEATISMTVTDEMCNGLSVCHGGYLFTLADSAFAFACNTYNQHTVAQHGAITFIAPAYAGERLTARAREICREGRGGIYDVSIANPAGKTIAGFRGHSRTVKGVHLPDFDREHNHRTQ
jgi:acyl-CoA thioesterase